MKIIASLESGIANTTLNELFKLHPEFIVDISTDGHTFTFFDETGVFYKTTGDLEALIRTSETGAYGLIRTYDETRIHLWGKNTLPPMIVKEAPTGETYEEVTTDETATEADERVQATLKEFHEQLDCDDCGEDITVGNFTILEATYYSDDVENGLKPYWQALVRYDPLNVMETVRDWNELAHFIRAWK